MLPDNDQIQVVRAMRRKWKNLSKNCGGGQRIMFDSFSKRSRKGSTVDGLVYDELPQPLKVQIVHILDASNGFLRRKAGRGDNTPRACGRGADFPNRHTAKDHQGRQNNVSGTHDLLHWLARFCYEPGADANQIKDFWIDLIVTRTGLDSDTVSG